MYDAAKQTIRTTAKTVACGHIDAISGPVSNSAGISPNPLYKVSTVVTWKTVTEASS